jgi:hypothetical protein
VGFDASEKSRRQCATSVSSISPIDSFGKVPLCPNRRKFRLIGKNRAAATRKTSYLSTLSFVASKDPQF